MGVHVLILSLFFQYRMEVDLLARARLAVVYDRKNGARLHREALKRGFRSDAITYTPFNALEH